MQRQVSIFRGFRCWTTSLCYTKPQPYLLLTWYIPFSCLQWYFYLYPRKATNSKKKKNQMQPPKPKEISFDTSSCCKRQEKKEPLKFSTEIVSLAWPPQALIRKSIFKVYPLETLEEFPLWLWKKILNNLIRELDVLRKKLFSSISEDMPHFQV